MALGTASQPLKVAIVGSGPSGFYAAEALLDSGLSVDVDLLERLPVPYGLVRYGVAPDHPKLKSVTSVFDAIARREGLQFFGNVAVGRDVDTQRLTSMYHAVILASGADRDQPLGIPGEQLAGVHGAADFVGWYNGHPDCAGLRFDLDQNVAVVVGHGNVALDLCRLLAVPAAVLASTDIALPALEALAMSRVREIHLVGRRGPVQARFTPKELRELGAIEGVDIVVDPDALALNDASRTELDDPSNVHTVRNVELLRGWAGRPRTAKRAIHLHFLKAPVAIHGDDSGKVQAVTLAAQRLEGAPGRQQAVPTGEEQRLAAGLVLRSVGYRGVSLPGLPFDDRRGVILQTDGRVTDAQGAVIPRWYATGWVKRGPSGVIGTNRQDSVETVQTLLGDLPRLGAARDGRSALQRLLSSAGRRVVTFDDWLAIDRAERERGQQSGKVAEKFLDTAQMLDVALRARGRSAFQTLPPGPAAP